MVDKDAVRACCESGVMNLSGGVFNVAHLEILILMLKTNENVRIANCAGTISMLELGAYLAGIAQEAAGAKQ